MSTEPLLLSERAPRSRLDSWLFRFVRELFDRRLTLSDLSRFSHGQLDIATADARLQERLSRELSERDAAQKQRERQVLPRGARPLSVIN